MKLTARGAYLYEDGKPFFWLGDTAWLLFEKLNTNEIEFYLTARAAQSFNVVQATLLHTPENIINGVTPRAEYFEHVERAVNFAKKKGIYFALVPCWGEIVKRGILNEDNYRRYANFLGERFKNCENIIWMLGGDMRGGEHYSLYCGFADILKKYSTERLITFHPFGRTGSYRWFHGCTWLSFNAFQSGHRRYGQRMLNAPDSTAGERDYEEDNYKYVLEALALSPLKPCLDAEPSYEDIPQGLHDFTQPRWAAADVRRYAYWSVLSGACGFTYGHNTVMQLHRAGDADANYGVRGEWRAALHADGAWQMKYLKDLMFSVNFVSGRDRSDLIIGNGSGHKHIACFAGDGFLFAYDYTGGAFKILSPFKGGFSASEMNPESGERKLLGNFGGDVLSLHESSGDRVIILTPLLH